jgi:hypothetical protein
MKENGQSQESDDLEDPRDYPKPTNTGVSTFFEKHDAYFIECLTA